MLRLRQVALVGANIDRIAADITEVLGLGPAYADPGVGKYGLRNQVWPIGDTFLEVVSPTQPGTTAGRLIDKRGGDGGYMAIFQVDDLPGARRRITALGVRIADQADRNGAAFTHLHPKDVRGAIVSIDAMQPAGRWEWGGPSWAGNVRTDVSTGILGAEMQLEDPDAVSARWAEVLDRPRERAGDEWRITTDGGVLRFVALSDERGEGLKAFDVAVHEPAAVKANAAARGCVSTNGDVLLCGTLIRLIQAAPR